MIELYMGVGEAIDRWMLEHLDEIDDVPGYARMAAELFQRISAPADGMPKRSTKPETK